MSSVSSYCLETLSNELLLEVFEYLDAYNLYSAFHGLNHRINTLLKSAYLHLVYNSSCEDKTVWNALTSFVTPSQIRLLSCYKDPVLDNGILLSTNENLRTLILHDVQNFDTFHHIFQSFSADQRIKCLCIKQLYNSRLPHDLPLLAFLLSKPAPWLIDISRLSLTLCYWQRVFPPVSGIFLKLRRLALQNVDLSPNLYRFLLENAPNLRSLKLSDCLFVQNWALTSPLKHILELHINHKRDFGCLLSLLSVFPYVRRLHIDWELPVRYSAPNGAHWQGLIENYLPHLKQLTINFGEETNKLIIQTFYTGEFWSTKKVNTIMTVNKTQSRFPLLKTIYFGAKWHFDYFDHFQS